MDHPCLPVQARAAGMDDQHEAGIGGWPLSIPHVYAAFPAPENSVEGAFAPASASTSALTSAALRSASVACFRKAAIEVDDEELTVILAPQKGQKCGAGSLSNERTPSTASTMAPPSPQAGCQAASPLPAFASFSRLVYPVAEVRSLRLWPKGDMARCWPNGMTEDVLTSASSSTRLAEQGPPWLNVAEVSGVPRGTSEEFTTLLALPSLGLAKRLVEAVQRRPRRHVPGHVQSSASVGRGAVRCELHMTVTVQLGPGSDVNLAAVVRRGICEACHVGAERVRICSMRDAASERGYQSSVRSNACLEVLPEGSAATLGDGMKPEEVPPAAPAADGPGQFQPLPAADTVLEEAAAAAEEAAATLPMATFTEEVEAATSMFVPAVVDSPGVSISQEDAPEIISSAPAGSSQSCDYPASSVDSLNDMTTPALGSSPEDAGIAGASEVKDSVAGSPEAIDLAHPLDERGDCMDTSTVQPAETAEPPVADPEVVPEAAEVPESTAAPQESADEYVSQTKEVAPSIDDPLIDLGS